MLARVYIARLRVDGVIRHTEEYDNEDSAIDAACELWHRSGYGYNATVELVTDERIIVDGANDDELYDDPRQPGHKHSLLQYISDIGFSGLCLCAWVQICDDMWQSCNWVWLC